MLILSNTKSPGERPPTGLNATSANFHRPQRRLVTHLIVGLGAAALYAHTYTPFQRLHFGIVHTAPYSASGMWSKPQVTGTYGCSSCLRQGRFRLHLCQPDGSTCSYSPLPSAYRPVSATVRQIGGREGLVGMSGLTLGGPRFPREVDRHLSHSLLLRWNIAIVAGWVKKRLPNNRILIGYLGCQSKHELGQSRMAKVGF